MSSGGVPARSGLVKEQGLPTLLTSGEVAELLRTSRKAIYTMAERRRDRKSTRLNSSHT